MDVKLSFDIVITAESEEKVRRWLMDESFANKYRLASLVVGDNLFGANGVYGFPHGAL